MTATTPVRTEPAGSIDDEVAAALRRLRRAGTGLLVMAMIVDACWEPVARYQLRIARARTRVIHTIEPPGGFLASVACSLLEAGAAKR